MNSAFVIVIGVVFAIIAIGLFAFYTVRVTRETERDRIPGPDEVFIPENDEDHFPHKGDFYIRDTKNDLNPFEMYNIYRIDDIKKNVYGTYWVKYTAPGYGSDYAPKWKELESPLDSFLSGKIRVEKIEKRKIWTLKPQRSE